MDGGVQPATAAADLDEIVREARISLCGKVADDCGVSLDPVDVDLVIRRACKAARDKGWYEGIKYVEGLRQLLSEQETTIASLQEDLALAKQMVTIESRRANQAETELQQLREQLEGELANGTTLFRQLQQAEKQVEKLESELEQLRQQLEKLNGLRTQTLERYLTNEQKRMQSKLQQAEADKERLREALEQIADQRVLVLDSPPENETLADALTKVARDSIDAARK
jgi:DNA repair exonuclease SbcCD ATPase subunit